MHLKYQKTQKKLAVKLLGWLSVTVVSGRPVRPLDCNSLTRQDAASIKKCYEYFHLPNDTVIHPRAV